MTLIEMLASISIIGIAAAGLSGLVLLNAMSTVRMSNRVDGLNAARQAIERLGKDLRMARNVGDIYTAASTSFPSAGNPLYSAGAPPGGWSNDPDWSQRPYVLSDNTLIIQQPIFMKDNPQTSPNEDGWPSAIYVDALGAGNPSTTMDNVDTVVYRVIPDRDNPGTFKLQFSMFPGWSSPSFGSSPFQEQRPAISVPVTILKGITNQSVFQYLDKTDPTGTPQAIISSGAIDNITGIVVTLQILNTQSGTTAPSNVSIKSELYMRNNPLGTITGTTGG